MSKEAMKLALENSQPSFMSPGWTLVRNEDITAMREALAEQPAQQEPVEVPTTPEAHRKFVLVGREWYERFATFHDDCQIGEHLTREEKTIRLQGYENGWNDAQRYLREQHTAPQPAQQEPVAWMHEWEDGERIPMLTGRDDRNNDQPKSVRPLVYADTPPQPAQPSKPLVGLTSEDKVEILRANGEAAVLILTEAKLREKNT